MNIGIDLDNVLADFGTTWLEFHNKRYGTSFAIEDMTAHDSSSIMEITREEFVNRIYEFYNSPEFDDIVPEPGAVEAIPPLAGRHTLFIVTSRPDSMIPRTQEWIERYFDGHFREILHSNQFSKEPSGSVTKASICKDNRIPILIEDAPDYAEEVATEGITALLLDQPWNQDLQESEHIVRVDSWEEIVKEVERFSKIS